MQGVKLISHVINGNKLRVRLSGAQTDCELFISKSYPPHTHHATIRSMQGPPDIDSQFIQAIQPWIAPLTTNEEAECKQNRGLRRSHTVRTCELLCRGGQGGPDRRTTAGSQLTTIPELRTTFFKQSNWTHARQECQGRTQKKKKPLLACLCFFEITVHCFNLLLSVKDILDISKFGFIFEIFFSPPPLQNI